MEINKRHKRYMMAALKVAPEKGQAFKIFDVGESAGFSKGEIEDIVRELASMNPPQLIRSTGYEATLAKGRETARLALDEEREQRAAKRKKVAFGIIKGIWAVAVTAITLIVIPIYVHRVEHRLDKLETEQTPHPTSQP